MDIPHLVYLFIVDGHVGYFQVLAIVNTASMLLCGHLFSFFLGIYLGWDCWVIR